jgi:hypothetical protein
MEIKTIVDVTDCEDLQAYLSRRLCYRGLEDFPLYVPGSCRSQYSGYSKTRHYLELLGLLIRTSYMLDFG